MTIFKLGGGGMWVPAWFNEVDAAYTFGSSSLMDASTEKAAFIGRFYHKDGAAKNVSKIGFRFGAITKSGTTDIQVSLQDMLATAQNPDEVVDQSGLVGNANIVANTYVEVTLGATRSMTPGDLIAVVFEYGTFVAADSVVISCIDGHISQPFGHGAYNRLKTGGAWGTGADNNNVVLGCDDGTYGGLAGGFAGISAWAATAIASNGTPDEVALPLMFPWRCTTDRGWMMVDPDGDFDVVLYEGTTARRTVSFDTDNVRNTQFGPPPHPLIVPWSSHFTFEPNVQYYIALKPTTVTAAAYVSMTVSNAAQLQSLDGGPDFSFAERTDAGAWSTTATKRLAAGISINGVEGAGPVSSIISNVYRHPHVPEGGRF